MLFGKTPFYDNNLEELQNKIIHNDVMFDKSIVSDECVDFIESLLEKNKKKRLGSIGGLHEIRQHPWVCDEDWEEIMERTKKPPFVPKTAGKQWKKNFDMLKERSDSPMSMQDSDLVKEYEELFDDFFFKRKKRRKKKYKNSARL